MKEMVNFNLLFTHNCLVILRSEIFNRVKLKDLTLTSKNLLYFNYIMKQLKEFTKLNAVSSMKQDTPLNYL